MRPVSRALVSVYDKTGIVDFARFLAENSIEIVSTGSTASLIKDAGIPVTPVDEVTGFPECFDGRVKTLHPKIHGGILADRTNDAHLAALDELNIAPFDLVVVNLYPFAETIASGAGDDECVEQIDIGGPAMVRASAKNHGSVAIVTSPDQYDEARAAISAGGFTFEQRRHLAAQAFAHTAAYDATVASWFSQRDDQQFFAEVSSTQVPLRYGENPHQSASLAITGTGLATARLLGGKEMSFNNYQDTDAALRAAFDHTGPTVAIIKHANPCGVGTGETVVEAYRRAHACDPVSAFGGVIAVNCDVSAEMAREVVGVFTEVIAAPAFEPEAVEILATKKNLRILEVDYVRETRDIKQISGGLLVQERDQIDAQGDSWDNWTHVSGPAADEHTRAELEFAWRAIRSVKSNAILIARDGGTVGIGMGQVNRVDSARLAVERANTLGVEVTSEAETGGAENPTGTSEQRTRGAVAASDAFFPFPDGLQVLIDAGVRAVVQPGGSIRDDSVIDAAEKAGITMYLTGVRHFAH